MLMNYDSTKIDDRIKRRATDKDFILKIINKTTVYRGRKLLRNEIEGLIHYVKQIDFNLMKKDPPGAIIDKIAKNFAGQLRVKSDSYIDTHELMKRNIGTISNNDMGPTYIDRDCPPYSVYREKNQRTEGFNTRIPKETAISSAAADIIKKIVSDRDIDRTQQLENKASTFSSVLDKYPRIAKQKTQNVYLLLDSKYRNLSTDFSTFKWTVLHSANTVQGTVNTLSDQIHNISIAQFDKFRLPYVPSADNVYRKISLFIEEFSSMSVLLNIGRRYHMLFDSEVMGNQIELSPLFNDEGRFRFHTPINILDTITIKFQSPFSPVTFLQDRYDVTIVSLNPTQSTITFGIPHLVADGELVHLEEFNTLDPVGDAVQINEVNDEVGHIVTFIDNLTLRIDVALTTITDDVNNITKCFIASRRLIIPVRLEYLL